MIEKGEFESLGKSEKTLDGSQVIKANCIKLMIDRLGNIKPYRTTQQNQNLLQKEMDQSNIASEPAVLYQPKLTFYADHAEQNETEAKYNASLTMQERLKQTLGLIRSIFGDRSVSPDFPGTFTIKKLEALSLKEVEELLIHWSEVKQIPAIKDIIKNHPGKIQSIRTVSYTHLRAHETVLDLVCRLLLEKKNRQRK